MFKCNTAPFNYRSKTLHLNSVPLLLFDHFVLEINDSPSVTKGDKIPRSDRLMASRSTHERGNKINTAQAF